MSDTQMVSFSNAVAFRLWSSFIRGWYSKSSNTTVLSVDDQCFGPWIIQDMLQIDSTLAQLMETQTARFENLLGVGQAVYRLAFKNIEYCRFKMFLLDVSKYILKNYPSGPDMIFENIQKHAVENIGRFTPIFSLINARSEIKTIRQIYLATDTIGLNLGLILSSFIEFKKV